LRIKAIVRVLATGVCAALALVTGASRAADHGFTVKDSIELTMFSDPSVRDRTARTKFSPDREHFAVVTTRGLLASNQLESSLWVFDTQRVMDFVHSREGSHLVAPRQIARVVGIPKANHQDSYGALITAVKWSTDSKHVLFLKESTDGHYRLYRAGITQTAPQALTGMREDVERFSANADTVVYAVREIDATVKPIGTPINSTAFVVTGLSMEEILFPKLQRRKQALELYTIRQRKSTPVPDPSFSGRLRLSQLNDSVDPTISPIGHAVIVPLPVSAIPSSWESYEITSLGLKFKARSADAVALSGARTVWWPWQYAVVDLDRNTVRPLVDAPAGMFGGYYDMGGVIWSPKGDAALLMSTYLPLDGVDPAERQKRSQSCAAAVVRLSDRELTCVAYSRFSTDPEKNWGVLDAYFGKTDDDVVLKLWHDSTELTEITERYRYQGGQWKKLDTAADGKALAGTGTPSGTAMPLQVEIHQDLNIPPALWAIDESTGTSKKLWDPNPKLTEMQLGEASVYRWKDATGYNWSASLIKPLGYVPGTRYPLIIQTHGFHYEHEFITDGAYTTAFAGRAFATAGFMVLETRDRHDHESTSEEAPTMVRAFESAIDSLNAEGLIDPHKVGIIGFSRTCYYTESALIHAPEHYAAAAIADGVDESYMQYLLWGAGRDLRDEEAIYGVAPFGEGLKKWVDAAPGFQLYRVQAPLLIQTITPGSILEEWEIYASLLLQNKPVEMIYFPDGQHILQKPLERLASQQGDVDWFRFWLKGEEDDHTAKVGQYRRWRALRQLQHAKKSSLREE
jgi:hypothetical protein